MTKKTRKILITLGVVAVLVTAIFIGYRIFEKSVLGMQMRAVVNTKSPEELKQLENLRNSMNKIKFSPNSGPIKPPETKKGLKELVKQYQRATEDSSDPDKANEILQAIMGTKNPKLISLLCDYAEDGVNIKNDQPGFDSYYKMKLQVSSVYALGNIGDKKAAPCLTNLLDDKSYLSCSASVTLGKLGATEAMDEMIKNMEKTQYCSSVGIFSFGEKGLKLILDKLHDPNLTEDQRGELESHIAAIDDPEAVPLLKELLKSDDPTLRLWAGNALRHNSGPNDVDDFIKGLTNNEIDEDNRHWIIYALGRIGDPKAIPVIEKLFSETTKGSNDWIASLEALAKLKGDDFRPVLMKYINDDNASVRRQAVTGLRYCNKDAVIGILFSILEPDNPDSKYDDGKWKAEDVLKSFDSIDVVKSAQLIITARNSSAVQSALRIIESYAIAHAEYKPEAKTILINLINTTNSYQTKDCSFEVLVKLFGKEAAPILDNYKDDPEIGKLVQGYLARIERGDIK